MKALRTILVAGILLGTGSVAWAEDLLYVRTDNKLYTCDTQTGELTYLTDGTLQWIASPSFDEPHHTALYVVPGTATNKDGAYFWGNPVTGESHGPYESTLRISARITLPVC